MKIAVTTSLGILKKKHIKTLLDANIKYYLLTTKKDLIVGWGNKRSSLLADKISKLSGQPVFFLEDGFIRSFAPGDEFPTLSLIIDPIGIYYDATKPSELENVLQGNSRLIKYDKRKLNEAKEFIIDNNISKYNHAPDISEKYFNNKKNVVLVVDQTKNDLSVKYGMAGAQSFNDMLTAALDENPNSDVIIKTHPEVSSGKKYGYLTGVKENDRISIIRHPLNPISLLKYIDKTYVVTSHMGFESLLVGKPVTCFGVPYYAGWGVTDDRQKCPRRTNIRTVDEIFYASYFQYTRYLNPYTHKTGTLFDVLEYLTEQKRKYDKPSKKVYCIGFRRWRQYNFKQALSSSTHDVRFVKMLNQIHDLSKDDDVLVWGRASNKELNTAVSKSGSRLLRMEDGFIRSVGLGSDLIRPRSFVLDEQGIYFDSSTPSDLEVLLNTKKFTSDEKMRAAQICKFIVENRITKYNIEPIDKLHIYTDKRKVIFVPGQVDTDASIKYGAPKINTNQGLLEIVRLRNPGSYIIYKPHPDVLSGNRRGRLALRDASRYADHVETKVSALSCIDAATEVHTMTSLCGFDALLRKKKVYTYGMPFYAGWGLTADELTCDRRKRVLSLDELVAGSLIDYPIYWDWTLNGYTKCEAILRQIVDERNLMSADGRLERLHKGYIRRQIRKLGVLVKAAVS